jgi:excisionase family DNA binding protein
MVSMLSLDQPAHRIELPEVMDSQAAAQLLRVHLTTIQELVRRGALPGRKVGKDYRFLKSALLAWLARTEVEQSFLTRKLR